MKSKFNELMAQRAVLRRQLAVLEQEICGLEGHKFESYATWDHSGEQCKWCNYQNATLCHRIKCECSLPHNNPPTKD